MNEEYKPKFSVEVYFDFIKNSAFELMKLHPDHPRLQIWGRPNLYASKQGVEPVTGDWTETYHGSSLEECLDKAIDAS